MAQLLESALSKDLDLAREALTWTLSFALSDLNWR
jgi:hypothetical protein